MSETNVLQAIRLAICNGAVRVYRNNNGKLQDKNGRWVTFGLFPGSGDLIGWRTIVITPEMVGQRIAQFTSIEVKKPSARTDKKRAEDQRNWRETVNDAGGIAIEARSVSDAERALR